MRDRLLGGADQTGAGSASSSVYLADSAAVNWMRCAAQWTGG